MPRSPRSDRKAVCFELADGSTTDLETTVPEGGRVVYQDEPLGRHVLRHSSAHVMAQAVVSIWPGAKYAIGPPIEDPPGFYYDFDIGRPFTQQDLERIEARMQEIVEENQPFKRKEVSMDEASQVFAEQPYKLEIIKGIGEDSADQGVMGEKVSIYSNDGFVDLCRGPHLPSTGRIQAFKLLRSSGAYWRGDEKRQMLQRIYGTAWESKEALQDYLWRREEAERRDHRKLGRELDLFMSSDMVGAGFPIWLPKGATIRRVLEEYILEEERRAGYTHVYTPHLGKRELYEKSGHLAHFQQDMFPAIELDHDHLVLRPMNCPHHILIYSHAKRSYRELPLRIAEIGTMYRKERSGVVGGLMRVRAINLNDAHIFCRPDQVKEEFTTVVRMVEKVYTTLGITDYSYRLSLRDPGDTQKYVDNDEMWELGERVLRETLDSLGVDYTEAPGEAAFYGPKLDIQLADILGREETFSTVQLDFYLPVTFDLSYVGDDGAEHMPVMIHRGVIGALERIVAYLIELYAGAFPTWLAPIQAIVLPISERHHAYAAKVADELGWVGVRVEVDDKSESLGNRIRNAQLQKVPYTLVVGDREEESHSVAVRPRGEETRVMSMTDFVFAITQEIGRRGVPDE